MKTTTGAKYKITKPQFEAITLIAKGWPYERVAFALWDDCALENGERNEKVIRNHVKNLREWFNNPKIKDAYKEYVMSDALPMVMNAINKLNLQIDSGNEWVANKAANDVLREFKPTLFGEEDKTIHVQIEGMPKLGEPDD